MDSRQFTSRRRRKRAVLWLRAYYYDKRTNLLLDGIWLFSFVVFVVLFFSFSTCRSDDLTLPLSGASDCDGRLGWGVPQNQIRVILVQMRQLGCGHRFHVQCCDAWLIYRRKNWCPLCMTPVVSQRDGSMNPIVS